MKKFFYAAILFLAVACGNTEKETKIQLALTPPMGWNSFDSYGVYLYEEAAFKNLDAFIEKLKPAGYEYFVIDAGWFGEFELIEGTKYAKEIHAAKLNMNEYGLLQPSQCYWPNGLKPLIDKCHENGVKFGLHLMRGIPRQAVEENTMVKGTEFHARDIADTNSICRWCPQNYGVDMSKPGAQEFYNSLVNQMADWGVDFIKYDDIVPFPEEVQAVVNAIKQCGRPIMLSLSPGGSVDQNALATFQQANMLRVTHDIWDNQKDIDQCFAAWKKWQGCSKPGFWIDMDMIPFGQLQLMAPLPKGFTGNETKNDVKRMMKENGYSGDALFSGKGYNRWSSLDMDQKKTFIALRALSASPLMVGGDLPTMDDFSLSLVTDKEILACNQNGVMGSLIAEEGTVEVWKSESQSFNGGWIGFFNRSESTVSYKADPSVFGTDDINDVEMINVFDKNGNIGLDMTIPANGVVFIKFKMK